MLLPLLLTAAIAGDPFEGVTPVETSESEIRYVLGDAEVRLRASPGPDEASTTPRCRGGGADLFVDGTLDATGEALVAGACARLDVHAPHLARAAHAPPRQDPPKDVLPPDAVRSLFGMVAVVWIVLACASLASSRAAWKWGLLALVIRVGLSEPVALMGKDYPYAHLMGYAGTITFNPLYGYGWYAVMDVARAVFGAAPDRLHVVNLLLSSLTVPALWAVLDRVVDRRAADTSALLLSVLPLAVSLAGSEVHHVLCALLEVTAILGVVGSGRVADALAVSSGVLLAHARPDQAPFAAGVAAALLRQRRGVATVALGAGIAWRALQIGVPNGRDGFPNPAADALSPTTLLAQWWGPGSGIAVLDPWVQPLWLGPLAVVGVALAPARARWLLVGCLVLAVAPTAHMYFPTDVLRFQLPAASWWVALAAIATARVGDLEPWRRAAALIVLVVGVVVARAPSQGLVTRAEHRFLRAALADLPAGAVLRYDDVWDDAGLFRSWAGAHAGLQAVPFAARPIEANELVYLGVPAALPGRASPRCTGEVIASGFAPTRSGALLPIPDDGPPVPLTLLRAQSCTAR